MKISYIVNARMPTEKAHGYQTAKMCEALATIGVDIRLITPSRINSISESVFDYYNVKENFKIKVIASYDFFKFGFLNRKIAYYLQSIFYFLRLLYLQVEKDEIVFTRNPEIAFLFSRIRNKKTIFEAHSWPESKNSLFKFFINKAVLIVCNSQGTKEKFNTEGFAMTISAPNGVDLADFKGDFDTKSIRSKINISEAKKIIMYIGHLYKWKGIDEILQAAENLKHNDTIKFVVVGGSDKDIVKYKKEIDNLNLNNILLVGHVNKKFVPLYLKTADILLLPNSPISEESIRYTSPIKMFEYMASQRPIIASDLPSIKSILTDETALFFKAGNAYDLSDKIVKLTFDKLLGDKLAHNARKEVVKYTWEARAKKIIIKLKQ